VRENAHKTLEMGDSHLVAKPSKQMLGWEKVDLIEGVKIVGAATLKDLALDAGAKHVVLGDYPYGANDNYEARPISTSSAGR
jgi:predicted peroxiredoxin